MRPHTPTATTRASARAAESQWQPRTRGSPVRARPVRARLSIILSKPPRTCLEPCFSVIMPAARLCLRACPSEQYSTCASSKGLSLHSITSKLQLDLPVWYAVDRNSQADSLFFLGVISAQVITMRPRAGAPSVAGRALPRGGLRFRRQCFLPPLWTPPLILRR